MCSYSYSHGIEHSVFRREIIGSKLPASQPADRQLVMGDDHQPTRDHHGQVLLSAKSPAGWIGSRGGGKERQVRWRRAFSLVLKQKCRRHDQHCMYEYEHKYEHDEHELRSNAHCGPRVQVLIHQSEKSRSSGKVTGGVSKAKPGHGRPAGLTLSSPPTSQRNTAVTPTALDHLRRMAWLQLQQTLTVSSLTNVVFAMVATGGMATQATAGAGEAGRRRKGKCVT